MFAGVQARAGPVKDCTGPQHQLPVLLRRREAAFDSYSVVSLRLQWSQPHPPSPFATSNSGTMILLSLWLDSLIDDFNFTEAFAMAG